MFQSLSLQSCHPRQSLTGNLEHASMKQMVIGVDIGPRFCGPYFPDRHAKFSSTHDYGIPSDLFFGLKMGVVQYSVPYTDNVCCL